MPSEYKDIVFKSSNQPTTVVRMDQNLDVNSAEDASSSPGPGGGTRRAGNLWTAEARDDMFRRRENGESWEDICKDYPRRSRHAMQQQYSMMKKQKAIANGTWTTNRRGRKRRNPMPEPWQTKMPRKDWEHEDDATEDDDMAEGDSEDADEHDDIESQGYRDDLNGRHMGLSRSATEPVNSKGPQRIASYQVATVNKPTSNGTTPPAGPSSGYPMAYNGAISRKRRRLSQDMGMVSTPPIIPNSQFIPSSLMLERDDVLNILQKGEERARIMNATLVQEREAERAAYEQSIGRANRRATEAHERYTLVTYEHGDNMKLARSEFSETLKLKAREHAEAMDKLRKQIKSDQETHIAKVEQLTKANESLKKENESFREGRPEREKELERDMENLKVAKESVEKEHLSLRIRVEEMEKTAKEPKSPSDKIQAINRPLQDAAAAMFAEWTDFSARIGTMHQGMNEMTHNQIVAAAQDCFDSRASFELKLGEVRHPLESLKSTVSNTNGEASKIVGGGDTVMQEAPRTPPADQPIHPKTEPKPETNGVGNYPGLPSSRPTPPAPK